MIPWRAYYTGGGRYTSRTHEPKSLPDDGLLGIVKYLNKRTQAGKHYRAILSGDTWYFFWRGEWFSNSDSREENERRYPGCVLIRGKWTLTEEMDRVQAEMAADKEAP